MLGAVPLVAVRKKEGEPRDSRHFESPAEMNWSTMICAPLTKSPNCASQRTSASGAAAE